MYYSWKCEDLGGVTLYAAENMRNPDSSLYGSFTFVDRCTGYDIVTHFYADIMDALNAGNNYDTGIIKLCRIKEEQTLRSDYIQIQLTADGTAQTVTVRLGYGNGNSFEHGNSVTMYGDYFATLPEIQRQVFIIWERNRTSYRYEGMPNYSGGTDISFVFGAVEKQIGRWTAPDYQHPYGEMVYSFVDAGLLSDIPGGTIPCASDNAESRSQQSELRGYTGTFTYTINGNYNGGTVWVMPADYEGNNDQDDDPYDGDPNDDDPGGNSDEGGGDGDHQGHYEPIPIPPNPTIGPADAGFIYMLRMNTYAMGTFAETLVKPTWWTAIKNFFADPMDFICGIMLVPYQPETTRMVTPKFGENTFDYAYPQITNQYTTVDCGRLTVNKYFGSCFDNNPYTRLLLWLPYIGYRDLDPDEVVGKTLHIVYKCDCMTGDCVAYVTTEGADAIGPVFARTIAQFSGNCGVRVPFGSTSYDAAVAASVQLLGGAVGMAALGGPMAAGIAAGSIGAAQLSNSMAGTTVNAVNGSKTQTERSGVAGASAGYMSIQYPYLLRTVPRQSLPENYKDLAGYPSNIAGPLSKFTGYVGVETIDLNGIAATKSELDEITRLLQEGVYI